MTKNDYLSQLRKKLFKLPETERDDAIDYYGEYIEDAGDEQAAIDALGSVSRLAAQITAEYSARMLREQEEARKTQQETQPAAAENPEPVGYGHLQPPDQVFTSRAQQPAGSVPDSAASAASPYVGDSAASAASPYVGDSAASAASPYVGAEKKSSLGWIWYIILGIFALPVALPVAAVLFALIVALIAVCFALIVSFVAVVVALFLGSFVTFIGGFGTLSLGSGILALGGALIMLGLALLLIPLLIKFTIWLIRAIGRLLTNIFNSLKRRTDVHEEK